ncbi:hypothetical protein JL720_13181 [Aureococcus anophagefferens]|nr:hypothetical protein JL720_13181 [Aureococcus anophagefferens]
MSSAGTVYSFGSYSSTLKARLGLSQEQLAWAALCSNLGTYSGVAGLVFGRFGAARARRSSASATAASGCCSSRRRPRAARP